MKKEYKNPIAGKGDFADPFVLRFNGKYYLYATNPDIRCFSSDDLVDWHLEGPAIEPETFGELVPFAPEVVYSNGKFYMYTSPSGFGHYVLESDSPLGPFRKITENVGHDIDGSVFIDDDGKWYFYWAGEEGIWGCEMHSPTEFGEAVLTGAYLHGWTEGPLVCKRDGIYYMTYTGNHYLSNGYRIQTAWSHNPLTGYQDDRYNPAVIHTQGEGVGLGHNSTVVGPDLVSYYLVYHNLNMDASRDLNIDRIFWHGEGTQVLGPTRTCQPAPHMPDMSFPAVHSLGELCWEFIQGGWKEENGIFYSGNGGFKIRTPEILPQNITVEMHIFVPHGNEKCGIELVCGKNEEMTLEFSDKEGSIQLYKKRLNQKLLVKEVKLPGILIYDVLHKAGIQTADKHLTITLDGRTVIETDIEEALTGIGYFSEEKPIGVGFTALTYGSYDEEKKKVAIPTGCSFMPVFGKGNACNNEYGQVLLDAGTYKEYRIYAQKSGRYVVYVTLNEIQNSKFALSVDGECEAEYSCAAGNRKAKECCVDLFRTEVMLEAGVNFLKIKGISGKTILERIEIMVDGEGEGLAEVQKMSAGPYGKVLLEDSAWDDGFVEAILSVHEFGESAGGGILFRVTEPAEGGEGDDPVLGIDFFRGYSVSVDGKKLVLAKHNYDRNILGEADFPVKEGETFSLTVQADGCCICVCDAEGNEILKVYDVCPLVRGSAGIWTENCRMEALKFTSASIQHESPGTGSLMWRQRAKRMNSVR